MLITRHLLNFWVSDSLVSLNFLRKIIIVGHSRGGAVTVELARGFFSDFKSHVTKIFLTASIDNLQDDGSELSNFMKETATNYAQSKEELGKSVPNDRKAIPQVKNLSYSNYSMSQIGTLCTAVAKYSLSLSGKSKISWWLYKAHFVISRLRTLTNT